MPQLTEIWTYRGLVGNFAQRELRGKYKGSALGWFWSLLSTTAPKVCKSPKIDTNYKDIQYGTDFR